MSKVFKYLSSAFEHVRSRCKFFVYTIQSRDDLPLNQKTNQKKNFDTTHLSANIMHECQINYRAYEKCSGILL